MGLTVLDIRRRAKRKDEVDFSKVTIDSYTSEDDSGILEHEVRQLLKGCLKVPTQRESLEKSHPSSKNENTVRFSSIEFRQYVRILSDNPSTSSGPPIGLGWEFIPEDTTRIDLDLYERGCDGLRRSGSKLILPRDLREKMLREVGYSRSEISNAIRNVTKVKKRRNISFQNHKYDPINERLETVKFRVRRLFY